MDDIKKILFINVDRIGDVIRSTFLFRLVRERYPEAFIACLTTTPSDELLASDPHINEQAKTATLELALCRRADVTNGPMLRIN